MKIVISTAGRFHLFALARELEKHGHLERIYSGFIWRALAREDVPRGRVTTFPWFRTPYMALGRLPIAPPRHFSRWLETMSCVAQDAYVARRLPTCDVFVGHDGAGLKSGKEAQRRGCCYVMDTGTIHVDFRRALMQEEYKSCGLPLFAGNRAIHSRMIEEYETADIIIVPSTFVKNSFVDQGIPAGKVHTIPYGVRTKHFSPISHPPVGLFRVLFVGALSIRKGARYLFEAFRDFPHPCKELVIVGAIAQEARPLVASLCGLNVRLLGPIPHTALSRIYSSSHALVLPSIEEGLAMVMAEALACGCPVIASTNTGAADLFTHGEEGFIVPIRDSRAILDCLIRLADEPKLRARMAAAAIARAKELGGWSAYGENYSNVLVAINNSGLRSRPN